MSIPYLYQGKIAMISLIIVVKLSRPKRPKRHLMRADSKQNSLSTDKKKRELLPSGYKAECILDEGQQIPYLSHWKLIKTPGHTPDSICFYSRDEGILISGDTILNMKGGGELNNFCWDCNKSRNLLKNYYPSK